MLDVYVKYLVDFLLGDMRGRYEKKKKRANIFLIKEILKNKV